MPAAMNATSQRPEFSPPRDSTSSTRAFFGFAGEPPVVHGPIFHSQSPPEECSAEALYLTRRREGVQQYFRDAMGVDDFLARVEIELCKNGFTGDNSIGARNCHCYHGPMAPDEMRVALPPYLSLYAPSSRTC